MSQCARILRVLRLLFLPEPPLYPPVCDNGVYRADWAAFSFRRLSCGVPLASPFSAPLIANEIEHFFKYELATRTPSSVRCLSLYFRSFPGVLTLASSSVSSFALPPLPQGGSSRRCDPALWWNRQMELHSG